MARCPGQPFVLLAGGIAATGMSMTFMSFVWMNAIAYRACDKISGAEMIYLLASGFICDMLGDVAQLYLFGHPTGKRGIVHTVCATTVLVIVLFARAVFVSA